MPQFRLHLLHLLHPDEWPSRNHLTMPPRSAAPHPRADSGW
jgi:hypothetical protein